MESRLRWSLCVLLLLASQVLAKKFELKGGETKWALVKGKQKLVLDIELGPEEVYKDKQMFDLIVGGTTLKVETEWIDSLKNVAFVVKSIDGKSAARLVRPKQIIVTPGMLIIGDSYDGHLGSVIFHEGTFKFEAVEDEVETYRISIGLSGNVPPGFMLKSNTVQVFDFEVKAEPPVNDRDE